MASLGTVTACPSRSPLLRRSCRESRAEPFTLGARVNNSCGKKRTDESASPMGAADISVPLIPPNRGVAKVAPIASAARSSEPGSVTEKRSPDIFSQRGRRRLSRRASVSRCRAFARSISFGLAKKRDERRYARPKFVRFAISLSQAYNYLQITR